MTCHCGQGADPKCWGDEGTEAHRDRCCDCFDSTLIPRDEFEDGVFCVKCSNA